MATARNRNRRRVEFVRPRWRRRAQRIDASRKHVEATGMWTWFHDPRAIHSSNRTYIVWHQDSGIQVGVYDHEQQSWGQTRLGEMSHNDHDVGVIGLLEDGRLMVCYSIHNGALRMRISRHPGDITAWEEERILSDGLCTYPTLEYLSQERRWYLFYRRREVSDDPALRKHMPFRVRVSDDQGVTWADEQTIFDVPGHRPYVKVTGDGHSRLDFFATDGHPNEFHHNSVYHFYYNGSWRDSFGRVMGQPAFTTSQVTRVHDGSVTPAWVWDIAPGPVGAFAMFNDIGDHRYMRATFDGAWQVAEIARGGGSIAADGTEPHYSAGIALDHGDPLQLYVATFDSGESSLHRIILDAHGTERSRQVVAAPEQDVKNVRPVVVRGEQRVLWWSGTYDGYRQFHCALRSAPILGERG